MNYGKIINNLQDIIDRDTTNENVRITAQNILFNLRKKIKAENINIEKEEQSLIDLGLGNFIFKNIRNVECKYNDDTYRLEFVSFSNEVSINSNLKFKNITEQLVYEAIQLVLGCGNYDIKCELKSNVYKNEKLIDNLGRFRVWGYNHNNIGDDCDTAWMNSPDEQYPNEINQHFRDLILKEWNNYWMSFQNFLPKYEYERIGD
jgi:hypothetical protein